MAPERKRMGVYSTVPSAFQRTEQFRCLDGALFTPPYQEILAAGSENDLPGSARAIKRRKIVALAEDLLHGRSLFISSAASGGPTLHNLVISRLKEHDQQWPRASENNKDAPVWQDVDDCWTVLKKARLQSRLKEHSVTPRRSSASKRPMDASRTAIYRKDRDGAQAAVIDETILSDEFPPAECQPSADRADAQHDPSEAQRANVPRTSSTSTHKPTTEARRHKTSTRKSSTLQCMITNTYKRSKASNQLSTNDKDSEVDEEEHAVLLARPLRPYHDTDHRNKPQPLKVLSHVDESSPFVFRKSRPRTKRSTDTVVTGAVQQGHEIPPSHSHLDQVTHVEPLVIHSSATKTHPTLVSEHLNKVLPMSPASGKTSSSLRRALRQELRHSGAAINQVDDPQRLSPTTIKTSLTGIEQLCVSAAQSIPPPIWPGTQALIAQALEAFTDSPIQQSVLAQQTDNTGLVNDSVIIAADDLDSQVGGAHPLETQDIMNTWSPWSASKTQQQKYRASKASPTINPKHMLKSNARPSDKKRGKKDSRSSLRFSIDLDRSTGLAWSATAGSGWTPVNNMYETDLKQLDNIGSALNHNDTSLLDTLGFGEAQVDSLEAARVEMEMDQCITDIADHFCNSGATKIKARTDGNHAGGQEDGECNRSESSA